MTRSLRLDARPDELEEKKLRRLLRLDNIAPEDSKFLVSLTLTLPHLFLAQGGAPVLRLFAQRYASILVSWGKEQGRV